MNINFKSIITNPFVIGGTVAGASVITAAVIYGKKRPKTDAEIALERDKEAHEQELRLKELEIKKQLDEAREQEETKRQAKEQEERTKREEIMLQQIKAKSEEAEKQRAWERDMAMNAKPEYWQAQQAKNIAEEQTKLAEKELENRERIARIQADADKSAAEAQAKAAKEASYMALRRQESADRADSAKWQAGFGALSSIVTGKASS